MKSCPQIIVVILAMLLIATTATAGIASLGFRLGGSYSHLVTTNVVPYYNYYDKVDSGMSSEWKMGPAAGLFLEIALSNSFSIQPEALYYRMGGQNDLYLTNEEGDHTGTGTVYLHLDYIQIPALLRFNIPPDRKASPYLVVGPAVAFNLSATTVYDPLDRSEDFENVEDIEFSAVLGAGCDLAVGQVALILDVRYNLGLSDIVEDSRNYNLENRSWQFTVGLGF